jgi:predicted Zn-dependent protease
VFKSQRRLLSLFFALGLSISLFLGNISLSQAVSWEELLFRGIQIIQINSLSDRQEVDFGRQIRQQLISEGKIKLYRDNNLSNYVNQIGRRLVAVSDRPNIPYSFEIVDNPQVNAFATMGGFIYLHTGLLQTASNEAELASVIGHEIGHVVAKHSQQQMQQQALTQGLLSAAGLQRTQVVQLGVTLALNLPHSRQDEYEADGLGLEMLKAAGYAPQPMVDFMRKLGKAGGSTPTLLSTHPNSRERVVALQQQISRSNGYEGDGTDEEAYRYQIRRLLANNPYQTNEQYQGRNKPKNNQYPSKTR